MGVSFTPTVETTGVRLDPATGRALDFTHPVSFIASGEDGSTQTYAVTVVVGQTELSIVLSCPPARRRPRGMKRSRLSGERLDGQGVTRPALVAW